MSGESVVPLDLPPSQPENVAPKSEWGTYEQKTTGTLIKSEFEQKVYIMDVQYQKIFFNNLLSLVQKELDTSFINDLTYRTYYQIQFENILEWANMGLQDLAKVRLAKLFGELKIEKSVGGFERLLQGSTLSGTVVATLPSQRSLFPIQLTRPRTEHQFNVDLNRGERRELPPLI